MPCPVCSLSLKFEPWHGARASFKSCPGCGIQFGYNDAPADLRDRIYEEWKVAWIANRRRPFHGEDWHRVSASIANSVRKTRAS
jgi:hypothetical protein